MVRLQFINRDGRTVDPVPSLVVIVTTFLVVFAWGPLYLLAFGVSLRTALAVLGVVFVCLAMATYYRMVWTAKPELKGLVPATHRLYRFREALFIGVTLIVLFAVPLLIQSG